MRWANTSFGCAAVVGACFAVQQSWVAVDHGSLTLWAVMVVIAALNGAAAGTHLFRAAFGSRRDQ